MHVTIMKIKNHKIFSMHITNFSYAHNKLLILFFKKYNYTIKIFSKIYLKFDLPYFHFIVFSILLLCCYQTNK